MGTYMLEDKYLSKSKEGDDQVFTGPGNPFAGWVWAIPGMTQYQVFNPTCKVGTTSIVMLSLGAQMGKDNYTVHKVSESIEVTPHHAQYYQLTIKQREEIEAKIKEGLITISRSISDLELLEHDIRKYQRYLEFIEKSESQNEELRRQGEAVLKTIFVDQVDYYAGKQGQGPGRFSMALMRNANIFPTIVDDFMEMTSIEDLKESPRFKRLPLVEKHFLEVKWQYYEEWKNMFKKQVRERLERLKQLRNSRLKSLEEFKKWIYPYLFRLKAINVMTQDKGAITTLKHIFPRTSGDALAITNDKFWAYRGLTTAETFRVTEELKSFGIDEEKYKGEKSPYNDFTKRVLIFGREYGLINKFPWITKAWVDEKVKGIIGKVSAYDFWTFIVYDVTKGIFKYPPNIELEDTDWDVFAATLSSNALLVKLLELEAMKQELLFYVDEMLGIVPAIKKSQEHIIGYVEEGGRYYPVKDGDYIYSKGKRVSFPSLFDLEENAKKLEVVVEKEQEKDGKKVKESMKAFPDTENVKLVEAEVIYYQKKGKKYVFYINEDGKVKTVERDSIEQFKKERLANADEALKKGDYVGAAFIRAFLLKPKPLLDFSFLKDLFGWKYRKYRISGVTPYERDFFDRITQFYLVPTGGRFAGFLSLLYSKYGIPPEGTP